jgi:hypothetical protein
MVLVHSTAPVAQWIEHLTSNLVAVGSSPAGRAIFRSDLLTGVTTHSLALTTHLSSCIACSLSL